MRRPLVAGNWKMHGTRASVAELIEGLRQQEMPAGVDVAVFPSSLHIAQVIDGLNGKAVKVGAQDCAAQVEQGALTGELAVSQLVDGGCELVLVGHSERRLILGESDEMVVRKFAAVQAAGVVPVLCVGETREQREANATLGVVGGQLAAVIDALGVEVLKKPLLPMSLYGPSALG